MNKVFTVSLCNPDKDTYVTLELPADPYTVLDAWERLRPAPDTRVEWEMEDYGEFPVLFPVLQSGEGFPALNALAERLASLDSRQRTAFEGLVRLSSLCARLPHWRNRQSTARWCPRPRTTPRWAGFTRQTVPSPR